MRINLSLIQDYTEFLEKNDLQYGIIGSLVHVYMQSRDAGSTPYAFVEANASRIEQYKAQFRSSEKVFVPKLGFFLQDLTSEKGGARLFYNALPLSFIRNILCLPEKFYRPVVKFNDFNGHDFKLRIEVTPEEASSLPFVQTHGPNKRPYHWGGIVENELSAADAAKSLRFTFNNLK